MSAYLGTGAVRDFVVPSEPTAYQSLAVAPNFEQFDGLDVPGTNPAGDAVFDGADGDILGAGWNYALNELGQYPRPGGAGTPVWAQTYTPGPLRGLVGTLGGQPLWVAGTGDRIKRPPGGYTQAGVRFVGGPKRGRQAYQGIAQTVQLSEITANPPVPGDLASIISGQA
jgi:hypothetical protein